MSDQEQIAELQKRITRLEQWACGLEAMIRSPTGLLVVDESPAVEFEPTKELNAKVRGRKLN